MAAFTLTMLSVSRSAFLSHLPLGKEKLCYNYVLSSPTDSSMVCAEHYTDVLSTVITL